MDKLQDQKIALQSKVLNLHVVSYNNPSDIILSNNRYKLYTLYDIREGKETKKSKGLNRYGNITFKKPNDTDLKFVIDRQEDDEYVHTMVTENKIGKVGQWYLSDSKRPVRVEKPLAKRQMILPIILYTSDVLLVTTSELDLFNDSFSYIRTKDHIPNMPILLTIKALLLYHNPFIHKEHILSEEEKEYLVPIQINPNHL